MEGDDSQSNDSSNASPKLELPLNNLRSISSLFKKRINLISETVASNRIWLKCDQTKNVDVIMTFQENTDYDVLKKLAQFIVEAGLVITVRFHATTREICFYIRAPYERLLEGAEELQLKKPIKSTYGGGFKEFIFEEQEFYKNIENELLFFTTQEKQAIIMYILEQIKCESDFTIGKIHLKPNQKIIFWCKHKNLISQILPVHEQDVLLNLRNKWVISTKYQPLDTICSYFGVKLAFYFAWLGYYTKALVIPAILGLLVWISLSNNEQYNSIYFLVLCAFNLIWGSCFVDLWKQRSAEYAYKWRVLDREENYLQEPRPLYKGDLKISKVTNKIEPHYPDWKRALFRYFVTVPCICLVIVFTVVLMLFMFRFQEYVAGLIEAEKLPRLYGLTKFIPKMIYAYIIGILNNIYKELCTWLNNIENYREESTYENHLIIKLVGFQFINSYLSLFYIAFYLQNSSLLRSQLFAIFITSQLKGNIKESIYPYIKENMKQIKLITTAKKDDYKQPSEEFINKLKVLQNYINILAKKVNEKTDENQDTSAQDFFSMGDNVSFDNKSNDENNNDFDLASVNQCEVECMMPSYPDTFDDYLEMAIQYGLLVFFSPVFPLAALCALINNIIEIRSDAFKMCYLHQRPFGQRVPDIGKWQDVIDIFTTLGIVVNCTMLATFGVMSKLLPTFNTFEIILLIFIVEHVFFGFKLFLSYSIPKLPHWIVIEKCKLEFKRRAALRRIETQEIHKLKNQAYE